MIRRLVAVAAAGLVVGSLQPVVADTLYVYQGPPKLEFTTQALTSKLMVSSMPLATHATLDTTYALSFQFQCSVCSSSLGALLTID